MNDSERPLRREDLRGYGRDLELYPGVKEWFSLINDYCDSIGLRAEHYIISSGLKEIIEGCPIAEEFKEIYACEFYYDENGRARWMKNVVNYTTKTQFVFRINKCVLRLSDDERPVPFTNMLYFGDGSTDVPCMKLIKVHGGHSFAVYDDSMETAKELFKAGRVNFVCRADYSKDTELYRTVTDVLQKIRYDERLKDKSGRNKENSDPHYTLGDLYYKANHFDISDERAVEYLRNAADSDQKEAQNVMGMICEYGLMGVKLSNEEAVRYYSRSAGNGFDHLIWYYHKGRD